jgi:hypothetical protein
VARWLGGQSHLSSRKIYISENRTLVNSRWPGGRVASHIYLVGKIYILRKPPLVNSRWPGGQVATHIYLGGKSTSQKTAFGAFAVARWPGGQSHLSSRKIYRLRKPPSVNSRWPGGRVATHIYLVGKSTSLKTNSVCEVAGFWPKTGSASHFISLSYVVATAATLATGSFLAPSAIRPCLCGGTVCAPQKPRMSCKSFRSIHRKVVKGRFYVT